MSDSPQTNDPILTTAHDHKLKHHLEDDPVWAKLQHLPSHLCFFLEPNVDLEARGTTRSKLQDIMKYFDVDSKLMPANSKKAYLVNLYKEQVLPKLEPFLAPPVSSDSMEAEENLDVHPKALTNQAMRKVLCKHTNAMLSPNMSRGDLSKLYNKFINKFSSSGPIANSSSSGSSDKWKRKPHISSVANMSKKTRDQIRHALLCHCPYVFVPLSFCNKQTLLALYSKFVLKVDEQYSGGVELCEGVHYHLIDSSEINHESYVSF